MANIFLTEYCNLGCRYCFANEFVNKKAKEMSIDNYKRAKEFILRDGTCRRIGLIGGEPTTYSNLDYVLRDLIDDNRVEEVMLYTNGLNIRPFINEISHPKMKVLVNVNGPSDVTEERYGRIVKNLELMIEERHMKDRVTLGINMYGKDFEYDYMLELLKKFDMKHVRTSITVPNVSEMRNRDAHFYFLEVKPRVREFYKKALDMGVIPYYDCNKLPSCMIGEEDQKIFGDYVNKMKSGHVEKAGESSLISPSVRCRPVVDILPDLTAVRCFGLSEYTKVKLEDFSGLRELQDYYYNTIDSLAYLTAYSGECADCRKRKNRICMGGCLAFKIRDIVELRREAERRIAGKREEKNDAVKVS